MYFVINIIVTNSKQNRFFPEHTNICKDGQSGVGGGGGGDDDDDDDYDDDDDDDDDDDKSVCILLIYLSALPFMSTE